MLRFVYRSLLRLHPARFRVRFAEEMLAIFDDAAERRAEVGLVTDGLVSLVRQWTLRSKYWEEKVVPPAQFTDGAPLFYTFESFKPRTSALIDGGILTLIVFYAVCLVLRYTWTHPVLIPFRGIQFQTGSSVNQSGSSSSSLLPVDVTGINSPQHFIPAEIGRTSLKAVLPSGMPASAQSRAQVTFAHTLTHDRFPVTASPNPRVSPTTPSSLQSSEWAILHTKLWGETLQSYAGVYATDPPNELAISITAEDGQLAIEIAGESKCALIPVSEMKFVVFGTTNTSIEFVKDHDGARNALNINRDGHITHYKKD